MIIYHHSFLNALYGLYPMLCMSKIRVRQEISAPIKRRNVIKNESINPTTLSNGEEIYPIVNKNLAKINKQPVKTVYVGFF